MTIETERALCHPSIYQLKTFSSHSIPIYLKKRVHFTKLGALNISINIYLFVILKLEMVQDIKLRIFL